MLTLEFMLPLASGWVLANASIRGTSAIGLVELRSNSGRVARARIDMGKRILLDKVPVHVPQAAIDAVADRMSRRMLSDFARPSEPVPYGR